MDEVVTNNNSLMNANDDSPCHYEKPPLTNQRFWLVTVFGSSISVISIVENLFLFILFLKRDYHRDSHKLYYMLLAFFDVFVSIAYIGLMSINVLSDYVQSAALMRMWFSYVVPTITISHIAITSSSFLILLATYERYCVTLSSRRTLFVQRNRKRIAFFAILLGVISKGTMYFEFEISFVEECAGLMTEINIEFHEFALNTVYYTVWRFWCRNIVTVFMPFFCLAYLNCRIVKELRNNYRPQFTTSALNINSARKREITRSATRTLVCVVSTYLLSNTVSVLTTIWEHVDGVSLATRYASYYAISLDLISLLTNMASASRLAIYLSCDSEFKREFWHIFKDISPRLRGNQRKTCHMEGNVSVNGPHLHLNDVSQPK